MRSGEKSIATLGAPEFGLPDSWVLVSGIREQESGKREEGISMSSSVSLAIYLDYIGYFIDPI